MADQSRFFDDVSKLFPPPPQPDPAAELAQALAETTANLDAYIERRAQEIATPRIAAAEKQARELVAAVWHTAAFDHRRQKDLERELRRQVDTAWKSYKRLKAATSPEDHQEGDHQ